jgi:RNA polymerase sigma-70 factor, ECF subfamily
MDRLDQLLAATARGDAAAFAELYAETSPRLFGILLRMLQKRDWAEEALQDCYMRIWRRSESYAPERGAPIAWLVTIARYRALDLLRARRLDTDALPEGHEPVDESPRPDERAAQLEGVEQLRKCLDSLSGEQRRSVLLAYYEGYTHGELAKKLDTPLGTVKSWVRRGLTQLRACLEAH